MILSIFSSVCWPSVSSSEKWLCNFSAFFKKKFNVYLFLRDRVQVGEGQREREAQNPKQAPGSEVSAQTCGLTPVAGACHNKVSGLPEEGAFQERMFQREGSRSCWSFRRLEIPEHHFCPFLWSAEPHGWPRFKGRGTNHPLVEECHHILGGEKVMVALLWK